MPPNWQLPIFTSELSILFGFSLILPPQKNAHAVLRTIAVIVRVVAVWLLLALPAAARIGWGAVALIPTIVVATAVEMEIVYAPINEIPSGRAAFLMSHLSVINFVLDVPGYVVPSLSWSHRWILCTNVLCVATVAVWRIFATDYALAWGCYPEFSEPSELNGGYCKTYPGVTTPPLYLCQEFTQYPAPEWCAENSTAAPPTGHLAASTHFIYIVLHHILLLTVILFASLIPGRLRTVGRTSV